MMMISERIQNLILKTESGIGLRILWTLIAILAVGGSIAWYDVWAYRGFTAPEAMDAAQVARNLSQGHGYTTQFIQPFSLYLLEQKQHAAMLAQVDLMNNGGFYPDLNNAPLYPMVLAGLMKWQSPPWDVQLGKKFWSRQGHFLRYKPEFSIAIFNQFLLLAAVVLTFFIAKKLFDSQVAWLAALFTFCSNLLWKFSTSGLSTMLLLVIFLGLTLCLLKIESLARVEPPDQRRIFGFTIGVGVMLGLGMLTRYSFGWLIVPVVVFLALFGGVRRTGLAVVVCLILGVMVAPWMARNYAVSGTFFGTAGYAAIEDTGFFKGMKLMESSAPDMAGAKLHGGLISQMVGKVGPNLSAILQNDLPHLGGWAAILFFAGLLLAFRNPATRRLRYFTLMCLGVFIFVQALGRTWLSDSTPEVNSENQLVLLTPLVLIFGVAFFLTLLDQMTLPSFEFRYLAIFLLAVILCLPFLTNFLPPPASPPAFPPYYPPEIQEVSGWMHPDELMMSDMPWAVAWYGRHPCIAISPDTGDSFFAINDSFRSIKGIYLTTLTLDDKFLSNVARGDQDSWPHFVLQAASKSEFPDHFPLQVPKAIGSGLFFTDQKRW
jgi:Dolichyl-phosphate-mannose-protein mannosyltransferase